MKPHCNDATFPDVHSEKTDRSLDLKIPLRLVALTEAVQCKNKYRKDRCFNHFFFFGGKINKFWNLEFYTIDKAHLVGLIITAVRQGDLLSFVEAEP